MVLPPDFQFSQSSMQDFVDCARRFQLRYMERLKWPAVEAEPVLEHERRMRQGDLFHRIVHQHLTGVPTEVLTNTIPDDTLRRWWNNYLRSGLSGLPENRYPEIMLSAPLGKYRLLAKYDLLALEAGKRAVIVDWKTTEKRSKREKLQTRLQTIVYRWVFVQAGTQLNGGKVNPEAVEMIYWFAEHPEQPERFPYNAAQFERDGDYLAGLLAEIEKRGEKDFELTADETQCRFCTYRSLCQRGIKAGDFRLDEVEIDSESDILLDFDFDQIAEIEF
jgi:hypothetical protein